MLNRVLAMCPFVVIVAAIVVLCASSPGHAAAQTQIQPPPIPLSQLDVTHNDYINASDAVSVISAWTEFQQAGGQCAASLSSVYDVDQSQCLDVADAQKVAASIGQISGAKGMQLNQGLIGATTAGATFTVNSDGNEPDDNAGDGQCHTSANTCTLNAAIQESNILPGHETINFNIPKSGTVTIRPPNYSIASNDPNPDYSWFTLDDARNNGVTIDGYTQPGASENTGEVPNNAKIMIELRGQRQLGVHGIMIKSNNNIIRGLALYDWDRKFAIYNARYNHIEGNFIGTNVAMTAHQSNMGTHHSEGIRMQYGASYNVIGCGDFDSSNQWLPCTDAGQVRAARNLVIGNGNDGIHFERNPVVNNHVVGNWVGIKQDGVSYKFTAGSNRDNFGNGSDSLDVEQGPQYNWIGGETPLERNVVAGNESDIEISHGTNTQFNRVVGNYIGTDATGTKAVRNCGNGISFEDTPNHNFAYNNLIAGNYGSGVRVYRRANYNEIYNNIIGVSVDSKPLANGLPDSSCPKNDYGNSGVFITGGGEYTSIHDNTIANHPDAGIKVTIYTIESGDIPIWGQMQKTSFNTISHNSIYNNAGKGITLKVGTSNGTTYKANDGLAAPSIVRAGTQNVVGTACASCKVEVYLAEPHFSAPYTTTVADDTAGEGKTLVGEGMTNSAGQFDISVTGHGLSAGQKVTGTTTDSFGNTSEFATNKVLVNGAVDPLTPAATFTPTPDMSGTATAEANAAATAQANADASATAEAAAATATYVANVEATAAANAPTATAEAQTAQAQATSAAATSAAQTATSAAATATSEAATATSEAQSTTTQTPVSVGPFQVMLPLMQR
jgi:hypothetical protein